MAVQRDKVIASAEKLVAKGKIEPAIKEYERLLEDNPNDVNTLNRIGDLWVRINRNDEAVKVFGKIADHYSRDGFFLKAIAIYKKINKLDPSKLEIYAKLADLYAKQGLAMEAKSQYQVLADYYIKHGEPGNALGIYRKISELDPQSINVHVKLADLYSQNNQTGEALKEYDRVGRMLLKRGMLDEAVQVFRKALKIDPKNTDLVDSLVTTLIEAKDFDNARQLVESAIESNPDNGRLLAMLGKIQLGRGDVSSARTTLERAIAADPEETSVRDALSDLYLRQNDADRALEMAAPLVERALARGERGSAIELLNRIIRVDPAHAPTLERLVAVYMRLNEETNILASMNSLAEAHIGRMRFEEASKVLEKLIQREPQNAQHRTKLQFVRSQMGGVETLPPRTKPPAEIPPMEIEEPSPSFDATEEAISLELDASEPLELDLSSLPEIPAAPEPPAAPAPTPRLVSAVEQAAADLEEGDEDLDFITEHLTEAEVFAKYGLAEKATEHLRAVIERAPKNLTAHERLFRILLEEGEVDAARTSAQAYAALLLESGDHTTLDAVKNEFLTRGHVFEPAAPKPAARAVPPSKPAPEPAPAISLEDLSEPAELSFDLEGGTPEMEFELEEPATEAVSEISFEQEEAEPAEAVANASGGGMFELETPEAGTPLIEDFEPGVQELSPVEELSAVEEFSALEDLTSVEDLPAIEEVSEEIPVAEELPALETADFAEELPAAVEEPETLFEPSTAAFEATEDALGFESLPMESEAGLEGSEDSLFGGMPAEAEEVPAEEIGEVDFYIQQELYEEARRKLDTLLARYPGNAEVESRQQRVAAAAATAAAQRPSVLSRDEIETELLSAIPDDEDEVLAPAAPPPAAAHVPIAAAPAHEENLFADEDNFFDLAAELESELAEEDEAISLSEEEQSLEEIFKEFKRGVEQQLDSEDYDTHYNLGIAYKEMGLIDEAIGEFQLASKDTKRAVECASMLGLCFLEKGMPQLAIKWYRKGLEMPEITEEEHIGLLYDLASAYQEVGDTENAQKAFMEVYGMNSTYRDIVTRIKALEDARR